MTRPIATETQYAAACRKRGVRYDPPTIPKRTVTVQGKSKGEEAFAFQLGREGSALPPHVRQHRFAPPRRWCFDFAFPSVKLAVEVEGGTWTNGRHTRGAGFEADCEKYAEAAMRGWAVLRVPTRWATDGRALALVKRWMREATNA